VLSRFCAKLEELKLLQLIFRCYIFCRRRRWIKLQFKIARSKRWGTWNHSKFQQIISVKAG